MSFESWLLVIWRLRRLTRREGFVRSFRRSLARNMVAMLGQHKQFYQAAYNALNDELIKIQIEESVLRNIKTIVHVKKTACWLSRSALS